jgi:parvulin-like peptidyl-prolyl isomerase
MVGRRGIYDRDLARTGRSLESLIEQAKVETAAAGQPISSGAVEREMDLLRWQFGATPQWNALEQFVLRREMIAHLRARDWLEAQISSAIKPNDDEIRSFYNAHPDFFRTPLRLRASHLFLAGPEGYPDEVIAAKRALINALASRLTKGEAFPELVAQFSEDEATKNRAGDLNYFAEERMLPAVFAAAQSLGEGETSGPIRSRLGFHLLRLTSVLPPELLSLAQAAPEISAMLENEKRALAVAALVAQLSGKIGIAAHRY